jgi:hypothetical protein
MRGSSSRQTKKCVCIEFDLRHTSLYFVHSHSVLDYPKSQIAH